jgi:hypothetical protein
MSPISVSNLEIPCGSGQWNGRICHEDSYYAFIFQNLAQTFLWRIKRRYYTTELFPNLVASSSINLTKPFNFPTTATTPPGVTIDTFVKFKPGWFKITITLSNKPLAFVVSISGTQAAISLVILES